MSGCARFILGLHASATPELKRYITTLIAANSLNVSEIDDSETGCLVVEAHSGTITQQRPVSHIGSASQRASVDNAGAFSKLLSAQQVLEGLQVRTPAGWHLRGMCCLGTN